MAQLTPQEGIKPFECYT